MTLQQGNEFFSLPIRSRRHDPAAFKCGKTVAKLWHFCGSFKISATSSNWIHDTVAKHPHFCHTFATVDTSLSEKPLEDQPINF